MDLEENEVHARLLCSVAAIADAEAGRVRMTAAAPVVKAVSDMVVRYMEILARELEMFAQHAGRKAVNVDDVLLAARRNPDVAAKLAPLARELARASKAKRVAAKAAAGAPKPPRKKRDRDRDRDREPLP